MDRERVKPLVLLSDLLNDGGLLRDQVSALADVDVCPVGGITRGETLGELADLVLASAPGAFAISSSGSRQEPTRAPPTSSA